MFVCGVLIAKTILSNLHLSRCHLLPQLFIYYDLNDELDHYSNFNTIFTHI